MNFIAENHIKNNQVIEKKTGRSGQANGYKSTLSTPCKKMAFQLEIFPAARFSHFMSPLKPDTPDL